MTTLKRVSLMLASFGLAAQALAQSTIKIDGSSTVFPITEAVSEEFQNANKGVKVTVGISGTGGGFKKFVRGEIDISNASRPILATEMEEAKKNGIEYIELPVAFDALTVVVKKDNTWLKEITVEDLKKMWEPGAQGKITRWNQVRAEWPDAPLNLYGPGADSGTFDYFTEAVCGKAKASRGDFTASEDDNTLVQGVSKDANALGYFGYAYYVANKDKLRAVPVINKAGKSTYPSDETVKDGSYNPLARPIFIYINKKSLVRSEVKNFAEFFLKNAETLVKEVKYTPLPSAAYASATERLTKQLTGTGFGGHNEAGLHIDEIFKRPLSTEVKKVEKKEEKKEEKK